MTLPGRSAARRYAAAVTVVQVGWVARLFLPHLAGDVAFPVLAVAEMLVPAWAERGGRGTAWHPEHISERYGLFTLIVLGECVAAATVAMQSATTSGLSAPQVGVAAGGLLLIFGLWWWYFEHPSEEGLRESRNSAFLWGYAHYFVFASVAALGAGLEVAVESTRRGSGVSPTTAGATVAISVAVYLVVTGAVQARLQPVRRPQDALHPPVRSGDPGDRLERPRPQRRFRSARLGFDRGGPRPAGPAGADAPPSG